MRQLEIVLFTAVLSLGGCSTPSDKSGAPPAASAPTSAATSTATAQAATLPKAKSKVNGKSWSDASDSDIRAALKKAGWADGSASNMTMGAVTTTSVSAKKGSLSAKVVLIKPSGTADDPASGMRAQSPKDAEAEYAKRGAAKLDGDSLLAAVIEGKPAESKTLLDALVEL